jgi:hypothetical protein
MLFHECSSAFKLRNANFAASVIFAVSDSRHMSPIDSGDSILFHWIPRFSFFQILFSFPDLKRSISTTPTALYVTEQNGASHEGGKRKFLIKSRIHSNLARFRARQPFESSFLNTHSVVFIAQHDHSSMYRRPQKKYAF